MTTLVGSPGELGVSTGPLATARLNTPAGLAFVGQRLLVTDNVENVVLELH